MTTHVIAMAKPKPTPPAVLVIEGTRGSDVNAAVATGIWRIALMVIGVTIGTGAQVFLWPVEPPTSASYSRISWPSRSASPADSVDQFAPVSKMH